LALLDPWDLRGRLEDKDLLVPVVLREHQDSLVELEQRESRVCLVQLVSRDKVVQMETQAHQVYKALLDPLEAQACLATRAQRGQQAHQDHLVPKDNREIRACLARRVTLVHRVLQEFREQLVMLVL